MLFIALGVSAGPTPDSCPYGGGLVCQPKPCPAPESFKSKYPHGGGTPFLNLQESGESVFFDDAPAGFNFSNFCLGPKLRTSLYNNDSATIRPDFDVFPRGCQDQFPFPTLTKDSDIGLLPVWIITSIYLFYALAHTCEDFLVPALNILVEKTGIPEDVAGATILAAGCNAPELFVSLVGIYLAESTVGAGTVVGSTPFNLCCICGGASLAVGGNLLLNPWIIGRETLGLAGACLLFLWTLQDSRVMYYEAIVITSYYLLYVLVLSFFPQLLKKLFNVTLTGQPEPENGNTQAPSTVQSSMSQIRESGMWPSTAMPGDTTIVRASNSEFTQSGRQIVLQTLGLTRASIQNSLSQALLTTEPPAWQVPRDSSKKSRPGQDMELLPVVSGDRNRSDSATPSHASGGNAENGQVASEGDVADPAMWTMLVRDCRKRVDAGAKPSSTALGMPRSDNEAGSGTARLSGVLLKKSRFYTKLRVGRKVWQPRWFVLDDHPTQPLRYSRLDGSLDNAVCVDLREVTRIVRADPTQLVLVTPAQTYRLKVPPSEGFVSNTSDDNNVDTDAAETAQLWFDHVVVAVDDLRSQTGTGPVKDEHPVDEHSEHEAWYKIPSSDDKIGIVMALLTFPIKALVHLSMADVRILGKEKYYPVTMCAAAGWLAMFAFILTFMIEYIGCAIGLSVTVVGLSLGAVGTSFPNLYASILTARAGQGELSISQAIGSNTYNICLGLGFLWIFKSLAGTCIYGDSGNNNLGPCNGCYNVEGNDPFCPYLKSKGSLQATTAGSLQGTIVVSLLWIVVFWIILATSKNYLRKPPAIAMFFAYAAYVFYQIIVNYATSLSPICVQYLPGAPIFSNFCF